MSCIFRSINCSITRLLSVKSDPRPTNSKWTFWLKIVLRTRKCPLSFVKIPCTQHSNIHYSSQFKAIHQNDSQYYLKCTLSGSRLKNTKISDTVNTMRNSKNSPGTPFWQCLRCQDTTFWLFFSAMSLYIADYLHKPLPR